MGKKTGFIYDMDTCIGCGSCQMACKGENGLSPGENYRRLAALSYGWFSGSCNHCEKAGCVKACPTGAMYKAEDGTTRHDDGKCIGCGACLWNCPYGAVTFSSLKGVSSKCTSCWERRERGLKPACVSACPVESLRFGEIEESRADLPFLPDPALTEPHLVVERKKTRKLLDEWKEGR